MYSVCQAEDWIGPRKITRYTKWSFFCLEVVHVWQVKDYLYGQSFRVYTDNNPLTCVLLTANYDVIGQRWIASLASFPFDIQYRPGRLNHDADAWSRLPAITSSDRTCNISRESTQFISNAIDITPYADYLAMTSDTVTDDVIPQTNHDIDILTSQSKDPVLQFWVPYLKSKIRPTRDDSPSDPANITICRNFDKLKIIKEIMYRLTYIDGKQNYPVINYNIPFGLIFFRHF